MVDSSPLFQDDLVPHPPGGGGRPRVGQDFLDGGALPKGHLEALVEGVLQVGDGRVRDDDGQVGREAGLN